MDDRRVLGKFVHLPFPSALLLSSNGQKWKWVNEISCIIIRHQQHLIASFYAAEMLLYIHYYFYCNIIPSNLSVIVYMVTRERESIRPIRRDREQVIIVQKKIKKHAQISLNGLSFWQTPKKKHFTALACTNYLNTTGGHLSPKINRLICAVERFVAHLFFFTSADHVGDHTFEISHYYFKLLSIFYIQLNSYIIRLCSNRLLDNILQDGKWSC